MTYQRALLREHARMLFSQSEPNLRLIERLVLALCQELKDAEIEADALTAENRTLRSELAETRRLADVRLVTRCGEVRWIP
jgi:hypothetical protein